MSPGDVVFGSVTYDAKNQQYIQYMNVSSSSSSVGMNIAVQPGQVYTDAYFVIEHQPDNCDEYPASGSVTFTNINIAWNNKPAVPMWQPHQFQVACKSNVNIISSSSMNFTWTTNGPPEHDGVASLANKKW